MHPPTRCHHWGTAFSCPLDTASPALALLAPPLFCPSAHHVCLQTTTPSGQATVSLLVGRRGLSTAFRPPWLPPCQPPLLPLLQPLLRFLSGTSSSSDPPPSLPSLPLPPRSSPLVAHFSPEPYSTSPGVFLATSSLVKASKPHLSTSSPVLPTQLHTCN